MIRTVTGALSEKIKGNILMHEHICCVSNDMLRVFGDKWLNKEELIEYSAKMLSVLKERYNVDMVVDGTPIDLGRDIRVLQKVSEISGVKIVASTGLYTYPNMVTLNKSSEEIAEWFLYECEHGIEGTDIKPGILKCAADDFGISEDNEKRIAAMGIVQNKTGLPLYVHCNHAEGVIDKTLRILFKNGADSKKIIVGHTAVKCESEYLKNILNEGCYICIDQCHCFPNKRKDIINTFDYLCENKLDKRILISNDCCIYSDFQTIENIWNSFEDIPNTFGYIFEEIINKLKIFIDNKRCVRRILNENAIKVLDINKEALL